MSASERAASMSPDELIAVIERGLEVDERAALAASSASTPPWRVTSEQDDFDGDVLVGFTVLRDADGEEIANDRGDFTEEELRHFARHDPSRVLADVESKRAILADYSATVRIRDESKKRILDVGGPGSGDVVEDMATWDRADREAGVMRPWIEHLARPYLDQETP